MKKLLFAAACVLPHMALAHHGHVNLFGAKQVFEQ